MTAPTLPQFVNGAKPSLKPRLEGGARGPSKLSRMVAEALRYLGAVRNYAPATLDSDQESFDQFHQFLSAHGLPDGHPRHQPELSHFPDAVSGESGGR